MWISIWLASMASLAVSAELARFLVGAIFGEVIALLLLWPFGLAIALLGAPVGGAVLGALAVIVSKSRRPTFL